MREPTTSRTGTAWFVSLIRGVIQNSFGYALSKGFGNYIDQGFELYKMSLALCIFLSFVSFSFSVLF